MQRQQQQQKRSVHFPEISMPLLSQQRPSQTQANGVRTQAAPEARRAAETRQTEAASGNLFSQLQREAEKVRKWKVQMEIDLKQKSSQLEECQKQLQTCQKSALDLQLKNESLSMKLQEEAEAKDSVVKKVNSTREMCYALKSNLDRVMEQMERCEKEKDTLQQKDEAAARNLQALIDKYESLEQRLQEAMQEHAAELTSQLESHQSIHAGYKQDVALLEAKISESDAEKSSLLAERCRLLAIISTNDGEMAILRRQAEELHAQLRQATAELDCEKCQMLLLQEVLSSTTAELQACKADGQLKSEELDARCSELQRLHADLVCLREEMSEAKDSLAAEIARLGLQASERGTMIESLQEEIKSKTEHVASLLIEKELLQSQLSESQLSVTTLQNDLVTLDDRSKCLAQQLTAESSNLADSKARIVLVENEKSCIEAELDALKSTYDQTVFERDRLVAEVQSAMELATAQKEKLNTAEQALASLSSDNSSTKAALSACLDEVTASKASIELLTKRLAEKEDSEQVLLDRLTALQDTVKTLRHELEEKDVSIACSAAELQQHKKALQENLERLKQVSDSFQDSRGQGAALELELHNEKFSRRMLEEQLERLRSEMSQNSQRSSEMLLLERQKNEELHAKLNTLVCDVTRLQADCQSKQETLQLTSSECCALSSQVKCLQQALEMREAETRRFAEQVASLQAQVEQLTESARSSAQILESVKIELQSKDALYQGAKTEVGKLKEEVSEIQRQKIELTSSVELQRQEMIATMESYKLENEKVLIKKDKDIETLNKKLDSQTEMREKEAKQAKERLTKLSDELTSTKESLTTALEAKDKLASAFSERCVEVERLTKVVEIKEKDFYELQQAVQNIKTRVTAVTAPLAKQSGLSAEASSTKPLPTAAAVSRCSQQQQEYRQPPETPARFAQPSMTSSPKSVLRPTAALSLSRKRHFDYESAMGPEMSKPRQMAPSSPGTDISHDFDVQEVDEKVGRGSAAPVLTAAVKSNRVGVAAKSQASLKASVAEQLPQAKSNLDDDEDDDDDECLPRSRMIGKKAKNVGETPAAGKFFKSRAGTPAGRATVKPTAVKSTFAKGKKATDSSFDIDNVFGFGQEM